MPIVMVGCRKHRYRLILIMACLMVIGEVTAQHQLSRVVLDSLVNPPLLSGGAELLTFRTCSIDIGNINEKDAPQVVTYKFRNISNRAIHITDISTSCHCTGANYPKYGLETGKEDSLQLVYNPMNQTGSIDAYAYIYTDVSDTHPVARLSINGFVSSTDAWRHLPHKMGVLRLKRKEVTFREIISGQQPSLNIVCANTGTEPLQISADKLPAYISFKTVPAVIEAGQEADAVITLHPDRLPENLKHQSTTVITIQGIDASLTERTIKVNIQSEN